MVDDPETAAPAAVHAPHRRLDLAFAALAAVPPGALATLLAGSGDPWTPPEVLVRQLPGSRWLHADDHPLTFLDPQDHLRVHQAWLTACQGPDRVADSAGASNSLLSRGPKAFYLQGVPAAGKTAAQVEAALRAQVERIAREGVSEAELARVKTQWVASEVYKLDSVMGQAQELGKYWVQGLPSDAGERIIERLRGITAAQVQAVAAKYFGDDQLTVGTLVPQPGKVPGRRPSNAPVSPTGAVH